MARRWYIKRGHEDEMFFSVSGWVPLKRDALSFSTFDDANRGAADFKIPAGFVPVLGEAEPDAQSRQQLQTEYDPFGLNRR